MAEHAGYAKSKGQRTYTVYVVDGSITDCVSERLVKKGQYESVSIGEALTMFPKPSLNFDDETFSAAAPRRLLRPKDLRSLPL